MGHSKEIPLSADALRGMVRRRRREREDGRRRLERDFPQSPPAAAHSLPSPRRAPPFRCERSERRKPLKSQIANRKSQGRFRSTVSVEAIEGDSAQRWRVARNGEARRKPLNSNLRMSFQFFHYPLHLLCPRFGFTAKTVLRHEFLPFWISLLYKIQLLLSAHILDLVFSLDG